MKNADEDSPRLFPFLKKKTGREDPLPSHTINLGKVSNKKKTIWALNFHETSNYNDVDLVACFAGDPIVLTGLFDKIESLLVDGKVLEKWSWDSSNLEVLSIVESNLKCHFGGASHAQGKVVDKVFTVIVSNNSGIIDFALPVRK
jgi:hypothetical protein